MAKEKTGVCLVIGTVRKVHEDLPGPPKGRLMDYCMRLADLPVLKSFARRRQCCVQVWCFQGLQVATSHTSILLELFDHLKERACATYNRTTL